MILGDIPVPRKTRVDSGSTRRSISLRSCLFVAKPRAVSIPVPSKSSGVMCPVFTSASPALRL
nr:MAG TPA: hypothetical protein [Caudoviricetes sp.]